jgi:hypothetical protein
MFCGVVAKRIDREYLSYEHVPFNGRKRARKPFEV